MQERTALQIAVALACLVPIGAGMAGMVLGPAMIGRSALPADFGSHFSYLSGLLLGIGLGFATAIPHIETHGRRFRLLAAIVVIGGVGRLLSLLIIGAPSVAMLAAMVMELVVTPGLAWWQGRVARHGSRAPIEFASPGGGR